MTQLATNHVAALGRQPAEQRPLATDAIQKKNRLLHELLCWAGQGALALTKPAPDDSAEAVHIIPDSSSRDFIKRMASADAFTLRLSHSHLNIIKQSKPDFETRLSGAATIDKRHPDYTFLTVSAQDPGYSSFVNLMAELAIDRQVGALDHPALSDFSFEELNADAGRIAKNIRIILSVVREMGAAQVTSLVDQYALGKGETATAQLKTLLASHIDATVADFGKAFGSPEVTPEGRAGGV